MKKLVSFFLMISALSLPILLSAEEKDIINETMANNNIDPLYEMLDKYDQFDKEPHSCQKETMRPNGIIRLSRIEVYPEYLDEYLKFAIEVGEISLINEPGVLTMYAVQQKDNPCIVTILETYSSEEAYRSHIASDHFQKYKRGTLHMVKHLDLIDQTAVNPANKIVNYIEL